MNHFLRTPLFWILFSLTALVTGTVAWHLFPKAYPIINLNITMDRAQAIAAAQRFSHEFNLGPCDCSYAVSFNSDEQVKTFVELEAGGKQALEDMMLRNLYLPYTWTVRQFKPFDQHQLFVKFTPEGVPYGFEEILSEDTESNSIAIAQAQIKAESFATAAPWHIQLTDYNLVESSQEVTPKKRIDHTFTYERINQTIGEGFYRLKLVVSGDRVTKLSHEIKVPDAFNRRYAQMRSANANIAYMANLLMLLLYIMGCCFIGIVYLYRINWIVWQTPVYWAVLVALIVSLNTINKLPLAWMHYSTCFSPFGFLLQHGIGAIYSFIFSSLILSMIFIAAESLTRKAFGHHLQLWHVFNKEYASSSTVIGYTITGYLLVPLILCYTMIFTVITMQWAGWWIPSSSLFNPDILATYFPWLESISLSFQAGFMEECLFRAIPLASAALLGNRFGKRNWWIAAAFILQAVIFGAAHANYPAQPAYARLVELLADSALFGAIYLWLGLLPAIIAHFIYDVFWFGIPIFVAHNFSAFINKGIIIFLSTIPLIILLIARLKNRSFGQVTDGMYNRAWQPPLEDKTTDTPLITTHTVLLSSNKIIFLIIWGVLSTIAWFFFTPFSSNTPAFTISRTTAEKNSISLLKDNNIVIENWYPITFAFTDFIHDPNANKQHRFVWQTAGSKGYHQLIGSYLTPAHWITKFLQYNGSIMDRAEEYRLFSLPDGTISRIVHKVPETTKGASLSKDTAIAIAQKTISNQFAIAPTELHEISAVAEKQPERLDWKITYSTTAGYQLPQGEKRIIVCIAGDEVVDAYRSVHIPENWERAEENNLMFGSIITQICQLLVYLIAVIGALVALMQWQTGSILSFGVMFLLLATIFLFELGNSWPSVLAYFNTCQPFNDQLFRSFSISAIMLVLRSAALATMFGFVTFSRTHYRLAQWRQSIIAGISIGAIFAGIESKLIWLIAATTPLWPNFTALRFALPLVAGIDSMILHYISLTIFLLLSILAMNSLTSHGTRRFKAGVAVSIIAGFIGSGLLYSDNLTLFAAAGITYGILFGIIYYTLFCKDRSMIPVAISTYLIFVNMKELAFNGYPQAMLVAIGSSFIIGIMGYFWSKQLYRE